jgi:hypothetical protein
MPSTSSPSGDEIQEALRSKGAPTTLERFISLARFKKCACWITNQSIAQLSKVDSALPQILATSTGIQVFLRSTHESARAMAHALPPLDSHSSSGGRQRLVEHMSFLPRRYALFWPRFSGHRAAFIRSPRLDLEGIRKRAAAVPEDVQVAIQRGVASAPREELEAALAASTPRRTAAPLFERTTTVDEDPASEFPRLG